MSTPNPVPRLITKKTKPEGYHALKLEIEQLKKAHNSLEKLLREQDAKHKYHITVNKKLKGELIQLQNEVDGLRNGIRQASKNRDSSA